MKTVIRSTDFALTDALDTFIREQASKSMSVCSSQVEGLVVRLKDLNDPKKDKECSVELKLRNQAEPVIVSKRNTDAYVGIRAALTRAARTALRRTGKRQAKKHTPLYAEQSYDQGASI